MYFSTNTKKLKENAKKMQTIIDKMRKCSESDEKDDCENVIVYDPSYITMTNLKEA